MKELGDVWKFWCQRSPLVPGTPSATTEDSSLGDAGTPSVNRDTGNEKTGNLLKDQDATYRVNVWTKLTVEDCFDVVKSQDKILKMQVNNQGSYQ